MFTPQLRRAAHLALALALLSPSCRQQTAPPSAERRETPARITQFYAPRNLITEGEEALLCYGTQNAAWVKLDPPVEELTPSLSRCFAVTPRGTTRYTLSVEGERQSIEVHVEKPAPKPPDLIQFFAADPMEAKPGQKVTLCYGVLEAVSVELQPEGRELPTAARHCVEVAVARTTTFTLKARGAGRSAATMTLTVKVKE